VTDGQYRALVAYLNFWTPRYPELGIDRAIADIGITLDRKDVVHELFKAGWIFDEGTGLIKFQDG
jgi:hypothetical protein